MSILEKLQLWYDQHCDGDWEHSYGISIETLDNPGWSVKIDLTNTLLEDIPFQSVKYGDIELRYDDRSAPCEWINCYRDGEAFFGLASARNLETVLKIFLDWAEANTDLSPYQDEINRLESLCVGEYFTMENESLLRELYRDIEDLPNEYHRKKMLLKTFNSYWNELIVPNL